MFCVVLQACAPRLKLDNEVTSDNRTIQSYYPGGVCVLYNENIEEGTDFIPVSPLGMKNCSCNFVHNSILSCRNWCIDTV